MNKTQDVLDETKGRVLKFQQQLQVKLVELAEEGLLIPKDEKKIHAVMKLLMDALTDASQTPYEQNLKKDLISHTVDAYEHEITQQVKDVECRRYTDRLLSVRIKTILDNCFSHAPTVDRKSRPALKVTKLEKQLWEDIHGISQRHSRRAQLIEAWLQEFEENVQAVLKPSIAANKEKG